MSNDDIIEINPQMEDSDNQNDGNPMILASTPPPPPPFLEDVLDDQDPLAPIDGVDDPQMVADANDEELANRLLNENLSINQLIGVDSEETGVDVGTVQQKVGQLSIKDEIYCLSDEPETYDVSDDDDDEDSSVIIDEDRKDGILEGCLLTAAELNRVFSSKENVERFLQHRRPISHSQAMTPSSTVSRHRSPLSVNTLRDQDEGILPPNANLVATPRTSNVSQLPRRNSYSRGRGNPRALGQPIQNGSGLGPCGGGRGDTAGLCGGGGALFVDPYYTPNNKNICVSQLPEYLNDQGLYHLFSEFGHIVSVKIICDVNTGKSLEHGYIVFSRHDEAKDAISKMNGARLSNQQRDLWVRWARPRPLHLRSCARPRSRVKVINQRYPDPRRVSDSLISTFAANVSPAPAPGLQQSFGSMLSIANTQPPAQDHSILITGLSPMTKSNDLHQYLLRYGPVTQLRLFTDDCYAFASFGARDQALKAVNELDGIVGSNGQPLRAGIACPDFAAAPHPNRNTPAEPRRAVTVWESCNNLLSPAPHNGHHRHRNSRRRNHVSSSLTSNSSTANYLTGSESESSSSCSTDGCAARRKRQKRHALHCHHRTHHYSRGIRKSTTGKDRRDNMVRSLSYLNLNATTPAVANDSGIAETSAGGSNNSFAVFNSPHVIGTKRKHGSR